MGAVDNGLRTLMHSLAAPGLSSLAQRLDAIERTKSSLAQSDGSSAGGAGAPGASAAGGSATRARASIFDSDLSAALASPAWQQTEQELRTEMAKHSLV